MINQPLTRTATLLEKSGRKRKVEISAKRKYYNDHATGALSEIITDPQDARLHNGYKFEILTHDLLLGFAPSEKRLPFLRLTDPKSGSAWALWLKQFGKNPSDSHIVPKIFDRTQSGVFWKIDDCATMRLDVLGHKIRKTIELSRRPEWNTSTFVIARGGGELVDGLASGEKDKTLIAKRRKLEGDFENPLFWFAVPRVWDSLKNEFGIPMPKTIQPEYSVVQVKTGVWELKIVIDSDWLDDAVYPVFIDPTIVLQPDASEGYDASIMAVPGWENVNSGAAYYAYLSFFTNYLGPYGRGLLKFDLSSVPGPITSAQLHLWNWIKTGSLTINKYRVLRNWGEGNKDYSAATAGECSWNHYAYPNTWTTPGATGIGTDIASAVDAGTVVSTETEKDFDVTNTMEQIRTAPNNYGILIGPDSGTYLEYWFFFTSDYAVAGQRPRLTIEYEAASAGLPIKLKGSLAAGRKLFGSLANS